jgi:hypothetical protein
MGRLWRAAQNVADASDTFAADDETCSRTPRLRLWSRSFCSP